MRNSPQSFLIDANNYLVKNEIGEGGFGTVFLVQNKATQEEFAAKICHIKLNQNEELIKKLINREILIMMRHKHETIVKFYGYSLTDFEGKSNVILFLEYMKKGSLAQLLLNDEKGLLAFPFDNTNRQKILVGIARGMMYLHDHNIIHRDLKPENVLINDDLEPQIADFGFSKFESSSFSQTLNMQFGTTAYMAPESIENSTYNKKTDVFSFGILMYQIVTGLTPYPCLKNGTNEFRFKRQVLENNLRPEFKHPIKESIRKLIESCWSKDPELRPSFEEIFNKLAFDEDIYFLLEPKEENKYYLDGVDVDDLLLYVEKIYSIDSSDNPSFSEQQEEVIKKLSIENEDLKEKVSQLEKTINENNKLFLDKLLKLDQNVKILIQENSELKEKVALLEQKSEFIESTGYSSFIENEGQIKIIEDEVLQSDKFTNLTFEDPKNDGEIFNGIIQYLTQKVGGNIYDKGVIHITSNLMYNEDYKPKYLLDFDNSYYFCSKDKPGGRVNFDFKEKKIQLTSYSIRSCATRDMMIYPYLKSWIIEGTNDKTNWFVIHAVKDSELLYGRSKKANFKVECKFYYSVIRIRSTGESWYNRGNKQMFGISMMEFFGNVQVKKD